MMQVFAEEIAIGDNGYSQFGIMCTYLMLFHFDEYDWAAQHSMLPTAQARQRAAAKLHQNLNSSTNFKGNSSLNFSSSGEVLLPPEVFSLRPRIAIACQIPIRRCYEHNEVHGIAKFGAAARNLYQVRLLGTRTTVDTIQYLHKCL